MRGKMIVLELFDDEVEALMEVGRYSSKKEALSHALEVLLLANPSLRLEVIVRLFKMDKVTLEKGFELAGIGLESFKEELSLRGIERIVDVEVGEVERGTKAIREMRPTR